MGFLLGHSGNPDPVSDLCDCQPDVFFEAGHQGRASSPRRGHTPAHQHPGKQLSGCHRTEAVSSVIDAAVAPGNVFTSVHFIPGSLGVAGRARLRGWPGEGSLRAWAGPWSPPRAPGRPRLPHRRVPSRWVERAANTQGAAVSCPGELERKTFCSPPSPPGGRPEPLPQLRDARVCRGSGLPGVACCRGRSTEWKSPLQKRRGLGLSWPLTDCIQRGEIMGRVCVFVHVSGAPGTGVTPGGLERLWVSGAGGGCAQLGLGRAARLPCPPGPRSVHGSRHSR